MVTKLDKQWEDLELSWRYLSTTDLCCSHWSADCTWKQIRATRVSLFRGRTSHPSSPTFFSSYDCRNPDNSFSLQQVHFIWVAKLTCCHAYTFFYEKDLTFLVGLPAFAPVDSPEPSQLELLPLENGHILSGSGKGCPSPTAGKITQWGVSGPSLVGAKGQTQNSEQGPQI